MTLTTRLTTFFLASLAVVLLGFSLTIYGLARHHLHRRADDRLHSALSVLTAAAEVKPAGVEWEPSERRVGFGTDHEVAWIVTDPEGRVVDRGVRDDAADALRETAHNLRTTGQDGRRSDWQGGRWLFHRQRIDTPPSNPGDRPDDGDEHHDEKRYLFLEVTAGISLEPTQAALRELAWGLTGVSMGIWLSALLASRAVCRWALQPLTRMANATRGMNGADLSDRLQTTRSGDEIEALGREFNGLLDRVQAAFERQRRFTSEASHQLRTPLTSLIGHVEVALRRERPAEDYRLVLETVLRQAERLRRIVEAMLFLARADAEAKLPDRVHVDLREWLDEHVRSTWSQHPRAADVAVKFHDSATYLADVHPVLLGELTNVLIDNALKYSAAGTPVILRLATVENRIELSVEDEGIGIEVADADRLFDPFFRSAASRRKGVEGFGLGLAVARRIAEAHGGDLTATAREGRVGSRFVLRI